MPREHARAEREPSPSPQRAVSLRRDEMAGEPEPPLLGLQRQAGNTAIEQIIGQMGAARRAETRDLAEQVIAREDVMGLVGLHRKDPAFGDLADTERLQLIPLALRLPIQTMRRPILLALWKSFAERLVEVARANVNLLSESHDAGVDVDELPPLAERRRWFEADVFSLVHSHLETNEQIVIAERERLRPEKVEKGTAGESLRAQLESDAYVKEMQRVAVLVDQALKAQAELRECVVGYVNPAASMPMVHHTEGLRGLPVTFNADRPPQLPPRGDENPPLKRWEDLKGPYDQLSKTILQYEVQYPSIYALVQAGQISEVGSQYLSLTGDTQNTEYVRVQAGVALLDILMAIREARAKVGDLSFTAFEPVHDQLMAGATSFTGADWRDDLNKWVARTAISKEESSALWKGVLKSLGSAAAFCVATLLTGGSAAAFFLAGAGLSADQLYEDLKAYEALAPLAEAEASPETEMVRPGKVLEAALQLGLDAFFALGDIGKGGTKLLEAAGERAPRALGKAAKAELRSAVSQLAGRSGKELAKDADLLSKAAMELGFDEVARLTGKSRDVVERVIAAESGVEIVSGFARGAVDAGEAADLPRQLGRLKKIGSAAERDRILMQGIRELGAPEALRRVGGWEEATKLLTGYESESGRFLLHWRDNVVRGEMEDYLRTIERGDMLRTGTKGAFDNDFDWNFLGPRGSETRGLMVEWLCGRFDLSEHELKKLLYADFFVDPRRLHTFDVLADPALREEAINNQTKTEAELLYASQLAKADDPLERQALEQQRDALGIEAREYKKPDVAEINRLLDAKTAELYELAQRVDPEALVRRRELAHEIGGLQAYANSAQGGAYMTGGSGFEYITKRDVLPPLPGAEGVRPNTPTLQFGKALGQVPMLRKYMLLVHVAADAEDMAGALRGLGKIGERFSAMVREGLTEAGLECPSFRRFEWLASEFQTLLARARAHGAGSLGEELKVAFGRVQQEAMDDVVLLEEWMTEGLQELRARAALEAGSSYYAQVLELAEMAVEMRSIGPRLRVLMDSVGQTVFQIGLGQVAKRVD